MINTTLYLRKHTPMASTAYIWVKFYIDGKRVHFSAKIQCEEKHWSEKNQRVTAADKEAKDKNLILENILARVNDVFVRFRLRNRKLTSEAFYKAYNRPDDYETFYHFCANYQREIADRVEISTLATHKKAIKKLKDFAPDLHFDDIDTEFLFKYFHTHLRKKCENNLNTAYKDMSVIRKYVNVAIKAGYITENPFKGFAVKRTTANYTYLEEEEIKKLVNLLKSGELTKQHYQTLQLFLYMCFSSQHIGDAKKMMLEQFSEKTFGYYRIKLRNTKPELITVPISDSLRWIVQDIAGYRRNGLLFTKLPADQTMNDYLKKIAKREDVKITKNISHKTARHTFATFYLSKTKDLNTLKDIMGHSDIRETLKYAHVIEREKQESISCFNIFSLIPPSWG